MEFNIFYFLNFMMGMLASNLLYGYTYLKFFKHKIAQWETFREEAEKDKINLAMEMQKIQTETELVIKSLINKNEELSGLSQINFEQAAYFYGLLLETKELLNNYEEDSTEIKLFLKKLNTILNDVDKKNIN